MEKRVEEVREVEEERVARRRRRRQDLGGGGEGCREEEVLY